jgi:hypothetical protein
LLRQSIRAEQCSALRGVSREQFREISPRGIRVDSGPFVVKSALPYSSNFHWRLRERFMVLATCTTGPSGFGLPDAFIFMVMVSPS